LDNAQILKREKGTGKRKPFFREIEDNEPVSLTKERIRTRETGEKELIMLSSTKNNREA